MRSKTDWAEAKASKDSTRNLHAWALLRRARIGGRYECTCCLVVAPNLRQFPVLYFVKLTFTETYNLWMDVRPGFVKLSVTRRYIMCQNHEIPFPIHEFQRLPTVLGTQLQTPNSMELSESLSETLTLKENMIFKYQIEFRAFGTARLAKRTQTQIEL